MTEREGEQGPYRGTQRKLSPGAEMFAAASGALPFAGIFMGAAAERAELINKQLHNRPITEYPIYFLIRDKDLPPPRRTITLPKRST